MKIVEIGRGRQLAKSVVFSEISANLFCAAAQSAIDSVPRLKVLPPKKVAFFCGSARCGFIILLELVLVNG